MTAPLPDRSADTRWSDVDAYVTERLLPADAALDAALADSQAAGLPPIAVTPAQGKLLHLLARMRGTRAILEIGTLGGYSTIWLARALPSDGRLVTLEIDPHHADVARANVERAGLGERVDVRVAPALETLPHLADEGQTFDFVFIDADKPSMPEYFAWALRLCRRGAAIVCDNVVRDGALADASSTDANVIGVRRLHDMIAAEPRVSATTIQTVGDKGYDGFLLALVDQPAR